MKALSVSIKEAAKSMTLKVVVTRVGEFRFRLAIAKQLIALACWVAWIKCEIQE